MIEIENEIGRTRVELDLTLGALAVELTPKHLVEKAGDMVAKSSSAESVLGRAVRADPVPLALIGLGVAWLVANHTGLLGNIVPRGGAAAGPGEHAWRSGRRLTDGIGRNPLLFGLAGLLCGAVVAIVLPSSRREREAVAQAREDLWEKAEEFGHRAADGVRAMARTSRGGADES
jgi:Protein of unknown function (DUF3618)